MNHLERNKDAGGSVEVITEPLQSTALFKLVQNATQSQASKNSATIVYNRIKNINLRTITHQNLQMPCCLYFDWKL